MKRLMMAVMVVGVVASGTHADWGGPKAPATAPQGQGQGPPTGGPMGLGGPNTLLGQGEPYNGVAPDKYGMNPRLRQMFRLGGRNSGQPAVPPSHYYPQMGYGQGGPAYNPTGYPTGAYGPAQGTLVFPHQSFVRSPRDYFMTESNK